MLDGLKANVVQICFVKGTLIMDYCNSFYNDIPKSTKKS
jgi:hypothetical protein